MHHNLKKASKSDLKAELTSQQNAQDLMTILLQHLDNNNKSDTEKLETIRNFANTWYDMATYAVNDCTNELNRRKEEV
jgi:hypothetical protein